MSKPRNTRAIAAMALTQVLKGQALTQVLGTLFTKYPDLPNADRAFVQNLSYGTLRWYDKLKALSRLLLKKPLKPKDSDISHLLLIGLYQLYHLELPHYAVLNETVAAVRIFKKPWAAALLNASLHRAIAEQDQLIASLLQSDQADIATYSHPVWLMQMLQQAWPSQAASIMQANNMHPPMALRVNAHLLSRDDYLAALDKANIVAHIQPDCDDGVVLENPQSVQSLPGFEAGWFAVQDGAAQLCAPLLEMKTAKRVLDVCAAPGGKTAHLLALGKQLTQCTIWDKDTDRLTLVKDNLKRLQLGAITAITLEAIDATTVKPPKAGEGFDRILIDAPCSATGVIRRHPDIKRLRIQEDINQLTCTQMQLLKALWPYLEIGGRLVYATCSVLPQENSELVNAFLQQTPDAKALPMQVDWGIMQAVGRQILTGMQGMDGFYYVVLTKILTS